MSIWAEFLSNTENLIRFVYAQKLWVRILKGRYLSDERCAMSTALYNVFHLNE